VKNAKKKYKEQVAQRRTSATLGGGLMAAACRRDVSAIDSPEIIRFQDLDNRMGILRGLEQVDGCLVIVLDEECPLCHQTRETIRIEVGAEIEEKLRALMGEKIGIGRWGRWACGKVREEEAVRMPLN